MQTHSTWLNLQAISWITLGTHLWARKTVVINNRCTENLKQISRWKQDRPFPERSTTSSTQDQSGSGRRKKPRRYWTQFCSGRTLGRKPEDVWMSLWMDQHTAVSCPVPLWATTWDFTLLLWPDEPLRSRKIQESSRYFSRNCFRMSASLGVKKFIAHIEPSRLSWTLNTLGGDTNIQYCYVYTWSYRLNGLGFFFY